MPTIFLQREGLPKRVLESRKVMGSSPFLSTVFVCVCVCVCVCVLIYECV